jgi:hypothetical protein
MIDMGLIEDIMGFFRGDTTEILFYVVSPYGRQVLATFETYEEAYKYKEENRSKLPKNARVHQGKFREGRYVGRA